MLICTAAVGPATAYGDDGAARFQIVNGQEALAGAWPAMTALVDADVQDAYQGFFCGGTLIAPQWVLTAAHCVDDVSNGGVRLVIGRTELNGQGGEEILGVEVVHHPMYDNATPGYDIGLVRLERPSTATPQAIATFEDADLYAAGNTLTAVGWGATDPAGTKYPNELRQAELSAFGDNECGLEQLGEQLICAGDPGPDRLHAGRDTCYGDSGGPLLAPVGEGGYVQVGLTSFGVGEFCAVDWPAFYTQIGTFHDWVEQYTGNLSEGSPAEEPSGVDAPPSQVDTEQAVRVASQDLDATDPVTQAIAVSQGLTNDDDDLDDGAPYAVLARVDDFADALAGSALGMGLAPLLFTPSARPLDPRTEAELLRVLRFDGNVRPRVYLMGGQAAIPGEVDARLTALGMTPVRIQGSGREGTAVAASQEIERLIREVTFATRRWVFVASGRGFPDAVTAGQMAAYYGIPILLANTDGPLPPVTRQEIQRMQPERVVVIGGEAIISPTVFAEIQALGLPTVRWAGPSRVDTALAVSERFLLELNSDGATRPPTVAVNLRNNFNDVLSATLITGALGGTFFPLEGEDGSVITDNVREEFCGAGGELFVIGGRDRITAASAQEVAAILAGSAC